MAIKIDEKIYFDVDYTAFTRQFELLYKYEHITADDIKHVGNARVYVKNAITFSGFKTQESYDEFLNDITLNPSNRIFTMPYGEGYVQFLGRFVEISDAMKSEQDLDIFDPDTGLPHLKNMFDDIAATIASNEPLTAKNLILLE